jgi:hypothetical protein
MIPRVEAVIVCVDYADFLSVTLPENLPHLDDLVIVTSPEDRATQTVCSRYGVRCIPTEVFRRDAASKFNKSRAINHGLAHLCQTGWVLHLDADIVLPMRTRHMLANAELDPTVLYGMDRVNCPSYEEWAAFKARPEVQYEWRCLVKPPRNWPLGARIAHEDYGGYMPIGFAQLWNPGKSGVSRYPMKVDGNAEHTDVLHAAQWPRRRRALLPELIAIHLESEPAPMGANWGGRKTRRFGPAPASINQAPTVY